MHGSLIMTCLNLFSVGLHILLIENLVSITTAQLTKYNAYIDRLSKNL